MRQVGFQFVLGLLATLAIAAMVGCDRAEHVDEQPAADAPPPVTPAVSRARQTLDSFYRDIDEYFRMPQPAEASRFEVQALMGENGDLSPVWILLDLDFEQRPRFVGRIVAVPKKWKLLQAGQSVTQDPKLILDWRITTSDGERVGSAETTE